MNYKRLIENGINLAKNGKLIEAENNFKKAIEKDSSLTDSYINLANVYIIQRRIEEAINLLMSYLIDISFNKNIIDHFWKISQNFNREEKFFEIISSYGDSKTLNKEELAYIYYIHGRYYAKLNDIELSIKYFKKSIFFDELFTDSYINLVDWLERINEISQANLYLNKFSKVVKKIDYKIKFFEALLLSRVKEFKASENILNKYKLEKYFEKDKYYYIKLLNLKSKNNERLKNFSMVPGVSIAYLASGFLIWLFCSPMDDFSSNWYLFLGHGLFIGIATCLLTIGPRFISSTEVALLVLLESVLAPVLVWLVVGEYPGEWTLYGGAIVLLSLLVSNAISLYQERYH